MCFSVVRKSMYPCKQHWPEDGWLGGSHTSGLLVSYISGNCEPILSSFKSGGHSEEVRYKIPSNVQMYVREPLQQLCIWSGLLL